MLRGCWAERAAESLRSSDRRLDKGLFSKTLPGALATTGGDVSSAPEYSSQPGLQSWAKSGPAACCAVGRGRSSLPAPALEGQL